MLFGPCLLLLNNPPKDRPGKCRFCPSNLTPPPPSQALCLYLYLLSFPQKPSFMEEFLNRFVNLSLRSLACLFPPSSTSLALSWTSVYVCQNTDSPSPCSESIRSHLYRKQSSRFILPITSEHLLFKFQIAFFLGVNSVPAILGSLLTKAPTQHLIVMLIESYIHTLTHIQMCVRTQPHGNTQWCSSHQMLPWSSRWMCPSP